MSLTSLPTCNISVGDSYMYCQMYRNDFKPHMCYTNTFKLLYHMGFKFKDCFACFGYVLSTDGKRKVAVRHCWLEDPYFSGIDVSVHLDGFNQSAINYEYTLIDKLTPAEWLERINTNGGCADIWDFDNENEIIKTLKSEGFEVFR